ncbi:MAG TPA: PAS domain S-box protein, partial [Chitinivibrionales bacterium]
MTPSQECRDHSRLHDTLKESEMRFRKVFEDGPLGMVMVDKNFVFTRVNSAFCRMLGYEEKELLCLTFKDITHPDHVSGDMENVKKVFTGELPIYKTEKRYIRKDKAVVWGAATITAVRDDSGKFLYFLTMIEDITERKNVENELRSSRDVLELIFRTSPDAGIITRLSDGMIVRVNDRFVTISGYSREEVTGKTSLELRLYENPESRRMVVETLRTNGHCDNAEIVFRTKSGTTFSGLMSAQIINVFGAPHVYSIIHDLTERIKTEQMLQNAQKLESLGVLAGGIAHDFNNLLTGVFGNVDLACTVCPDPRTTEYLKSTLTALHRAKALTLQLLTFAKGGEPVLNITAIEPCIQESAPFALSGSNISCVYHFGDGLWLCIIDKNQIGQVIDNIIINAVQAMPSGGSLEISAVNVSFGRREHPQLAQGAYVKVSIKDHGIGIPADIMPRIFDPFYTTKIKGHGLGLATSYSIV